MMGKTMVDSSYTARLEQVGRFFMGTSDVHAALARLAQKLDALQIAYAVCGGMAVNAHGHVRTTTDIDVLVTPAGHAQFLAAAVGAGWVPKFVGSRGVRDAVCQVPIDFLWSGGIPGSGEPHGVVFPDPAAVAVERSGCRYVSLAALVEMKLACGLSAPDRPRDFDDVIQLVRKNQLGLDFAERLHGYVQEKFRELWGYAQRPSDLPE